jgi:hypothetical protein
MEHIPTSVGRCAHPSSRNSSPGTLRALWNDDCGFIISAELVMIATIVVLGLIAGLTCVRDAVTGELKDVANAFDNLNQSYSYTGFHGCWDPCCGLHSFTNGSCFSDEEEHADDDYCFDDRCRSGRDGHHHRHDDDCEDEDCEDDDCEDCEDEDCPHDDCEDCDDDCPDADCPDVDCPHEGEVYVEPQVIVEPPVIVAPQEIIQEEPGPIIPAQEADAVQSEVECDPALVETYYYETDDCYSGEYHYGAGASYGYPTEIWRGGQPSYGTVW